MRRALVLLAAEGRGNMPNPGSSLLNPRSQRAKLRQARAMGEQQQQQLEAQALFADIGGSSSGVPASRVRRGGGGKRKSSRQRQAHHVHLVGKDVAERAKAMTDAEWESVPMEDKHAFTKYMAGLLRERPTEASEQQRRRYFETTMMDPRELNPNATVQDSYQRLKMGLPFQLKDTQHTLGVSQALYDSGEASLFDPANVVELDNAMLHVKQVFADYMRKRREGTSTEAERRQLAHLTAELNVETQRHLANMFKYSEERLRHMAMEERQQQLTELQRLRDAVAHKKRHSTQEAASAKAADAGAAGATAAEEAPATTTPPTRSRRRQAKRAQLKQSISEATGMDVDVVDSMLKEMNAQEEFMQFCEVFARLTLGRGFSHTAQDEGLDAYLDSLRSLYSVDANRLSTLDVVQYMAAKDAVPPVEWARRWYEQAILVPLQHTPEYKRLEEIRRADLEALALRKELQQQAEQPPPQESSSGSGSGSTSSASSSVAHEAAAAQLQDQLAEDSHAVAIAASSEAAHQTEEKAVRLVEKMFMRPDDERLKTIHEKRLRYLAYLQVERQIEKARENAKLFEGVEETAEAEQCRALYAKLLQRRAALVGKLTPPSSGEHTEALTPPPTSTLNIFHDAEAAALFEQIRDIAVRVVQRARAQRQATEKQAKVEQVLRAVRGAARGEPTAAQSLQQRLEEQKREVGSRLLGILEKDVQSELSWLEAMEEAERPPLLPVPEGMSYVSAADAQAWKEIRAEEEKEKGNPFLQHNSAARKKANPKANGYAPSLFFQRGTVPDKPLLFWGTGARAVQQALQHAAEDAARRRKGEPLVPPYPCPENPWGWRLVKDILDD